MAEMPPDHISHYRIASELGKGSMGIVYEGVPDSGGQPVAIKVFFPDTHTTPEENATLLERFQREGEALAQLHHRNVVQVIEVGAEGGHEFIVMEKLQGFNIKELLALGTRFTLGETLDIMNQLLGGLSACHAAGVIHRDVKPANVVRSPDGIIKLTDFGIARIVTDQTLARSGTIVGTPNYMSPEQIRGEAVDARSDLFSAGTLFYELLTGKKPFDGPDVTAIMYNVTNVHPPSPRFYNGALPLESEEIVFRALAKNPAERYQSAEEFSTALRKLESDLHYREDTEAVLNALPASPDPGAGALHTQAGTTGMNATGAAATAAGAASISLTGGGAIQAGKVYCVDCGMENEESYEFCVRCMRPLLKRQMLTQYAMQHAKVIRGLTQSDYIFLSCLSIIMIGVVILILYLFFRGVV
jgi:eukaryotic-like serine/threonine-protein kinase